MKRKQKRIIAFLASLVLSLGLCMQVSAAGGSTTEISIRVKYGQTEARNMLKMINDFRTGDEAWQWDESDQNKVSLVGKLDGLTYDYNLEKIAMQRAAELAVSYSHTRPNGTAWSTLAVIGNRHAENIAAGYTSAETVFKAWQETEKTYEGQGHRRNMLSADYKAVGIGHASYGGKDFWVQEFGDVVSSTAATAANNSNQDVTVEVLTSNLTTDVSVQEPSKEMSFGTEAAAPSVTVTYKLEGKWESPANTVIPEWVVDQPRIASVSGGKLTANAVGSTTLRANVEGKTVEATLTVVPASLENAVVSLSSEEYPYEGEGKPITPKPTVEAAGKTLAEGTDYELAYADHTKTGTAKITVTGKGNYTGKIEKTYEIVCKHSLGKEEIVQEATCLEEGKKERKCSVCNEVITEAIPKLSHTVTEDKGEAATCTKDGKTKGSHCSVCNTVVEAQEVIPARGHTWDEGVIGDEATCAKEGTRIFTCTVCGEKKEETIEPLPHTPEVDAAVEPTCTEKGKTEGSHCSVCKQVLTKQEELEKLPHTEVKDEAVEATCAKEGKTEGSHCSVCGEVLKKQETIPVTRHLWDEGKVTKEPTHSEKGVKTFYCQKCGIRGIILLDKLEYQITKGTEGVWKKGSKEGLAIVSDGEVKDLVNVQVDGKVLDQKYYDVKSDHTTVTLKPEYLDSLSAGKHTYCVRYKDGSVATTFTVKENAAAAKTDVKQTKTVKTGDTAQTTLLLGLMALAVCGAAGGIWMKKRG